ncbi:MAG: hypothetical protein AMXMBFR13_11370 [Phycisphaerae bacterium]
MTQRNAFLSGAAIVALGLPAATARAETRFSEFGGGQQIWLKAADFVAGSNNYIPAGDYALDPDATDPLSGAAYYFKGDGDTDVTFPWTGGGVGDDQRDWWAEYQILPADLPPTFTLSGTWYFWARLQHPDAPSSTEWNVDSDWLAVNGDPGDLDTSGPTDAQWFAAIQAAVRADDRIANDVHAGGGVRPDWVWIGYQGTDRRPKMFKLIDGKIAWRIYEAEAGHWNARIDVICWANQQSFLPTDADYLASSLLGECPLQHLTTGVSPTSHLNDSPVSLTVSGSDLNLVTEVRLVHNGSGPTLVGTNLSLNPANTELTADFDLTGVQYGGYHLITVQGDPCLNKTLLNAFEVVCSTATVFASATPDLIANPSGTVELTITGTNVTLLTGVSLEYANDEPVIEGTALTPDGDNLKATFDLGCAPAGPYHVVGTRNDPNCPDPAPLINAVWITKPPPGDKACVWQPWAASWSKLNTGEDLDPDNGVYNPTNWDYSFSQETVLNTAQDTPPNGGTAALHFFFDDQPPDAFTSNSHGSGGVYQEIPVTPGVPLEYSFWWKSNGTDGAKWFELLLLDGTFNLFYADGFQESQRQMNNPSMVRKTEVAGAGGFDWTEVTHQTPADPGPFGNRPTTITPTRDVVTVVLKAGRLPSGGMEVFFDNVVVTQGGGPNLVSNGGFENANQKEICDNEWMFQDECESEFWRRSALTPLPCPDPFADFDEDGDVDQEDFGAFQACITGSFFGPVLPGCECFDRPEPDAPDANIDQVDYQAFQYCALNSGPNIPADPTCDDGPPPQQ